MTSALMTGSVPVPEPPRSTHAPRGNAFHSSCSASVSSAGITSSLWSRDPSTPSRNRSRIGGHQPRRRRRGQRIGRGQQEPGPVKQPFRRGRRVAVIKEVLGDVGEDHLCPDEPRSPPNRTSVSQRCQRSGALSITGHCARARGKQPPGVLLMAAQRRMLWCPACHFSSSTWTTLSSTGPAHSAVGPGNSLQRGPAVRPMRGG
jgi:hypothetical protein